MGFASSFSGYGGGYGGTDSGQSFGVPSAPDAPSVDTPSTDGIDFVSTLGAAPADVQTGLGIAAANGYSVDSGNQLSIPEYTPEQAELANAAATELGQTTSANQQTSINNAVLAQESMAYLQSEEDARQQYQLEQQLASEFEAGLLDEQARGTTTEPAVAPAAPTNRFTGFVKDALFEYKEDGTIDWGETSLKHGASIFGGPYGALAFGVGRAGLALMSYDRDGDIEAELMALGVPAKDMEDAIEAYYQGEHNAYTAENEDSLSPSIPQRLLSQGQQDPAAQQNASALFGPTHIYGALPGQRQRRGAYQYIPPTFGPIRS